MTPFAAPLLPPLTIAVELATNDFNWNSAPGTTVVVGVESVDETREKVTVRSSLSTADAPMQVMRLRFTLPTPSP